MTLLIKNCKIINENNLIDTDIHIKNGKIVAIGERLMGYFHPVEEET